MININVGDRVQLAATHAFAEATGRVERRFECADASQLFVIRLDKADETGSKLTTVIASEMTKLEPDSRFIWKQGEIQSNRD